VIYSVITKRLPDDTGNRTTRVIAPSSTDRASTGPVKSALLRDPTPELSTIRPPLISPP